MENEAARIAADCPRFACRVCRTKTGWPHQSWCALAAVTRPECGDCRYREAARGVCQHPAQKKGGDAE